MLEFQTIKRKSKIGEITISQIAIVLNLIFFFIGPIDSINLKIGIFVFGNIFSFGYGFFEYENLNANIIGKLVLKNDSIVLNNIVYQISEISHLTIEDYYFRGKSNISLVWGYPPRFLVGKGNFIKITTKNNEEIKAEFLINSKNDIETLNNYFTKIVIDNKINLDLNKLYNLPDNIKSTQYFKDFVANLLLKKEIECGYGILLIGYDSDQEAKLLREKYCS